MVDDGGTRWRGRRRTALLVVFFLPCAWFGNAATLAFDRFDYRFVDRVDLGRLFADTLSVGVSSVVGSFFTNPFFGWVNLAMLITVGAVVVAEIAWPEYQRKVLVVTSSLAVPLGLLALFSLVESLRLGLDGEWLAEGWPILEMFFFWALGLWVYSFVQIRERSATA